MNHNPQNSQKVNRKRFLNVIYFVDSNKTKTFKLSLKTSYILFSLMIVMFFWSIFSSVLLVSHYNRASIRSEKIRKLLTTIFNYQTRYDQVYEKTYPSKIIDKKTDDASIAAREDPTSQSSQNSESEDIVSNLAPSKNNNTEDTPETASTSSELEPQVKVEKFDLATKPNGLSLNFAIKNLDRPNKANGYVIGFAKFLDPTGRAKLITSPTGIQEEEPINKWALPQEHRFSIRYYTKKTLDFELPDEKGGTFEFIKIVVGSKDNEPLEFVYNIKGNVGTFAPITANKSNFDKDEDANSQKLDLIEEHSGPF